MSTMFPPTRDHRPILTIDTSSSQGGLALYDGHTLSTRSWPADRSHTATLLSEIHHLLASTEVAIRDLAAIGIATGPGAFTGLRVGFGVAKGFHLATGVPLIGVPTLEATALSLASCGHSIVATVAAGRSRLVWAHYESTTDGLIEARPPRNGALAELVDELLEARPVLVTGELDDAQAALIAEIDGVRMPPGPLRVRQPGALAEIAWRRWQAGSTDDAVMIEPVYLSR
jgi:tRNA threonylcarbamoyladenosine biosynthesis protein TsaB